MTATRQHCLLALLILIVVDVMVLGILLYSVGDGAMHYAAYNGSPEMSEHYRTPFTGGRLLVLVALVLANLGALVTVIAMWFTVGKQQRLA